MQVIYLRGDPNKRNERMGSTDRKETWNRDQGYEADTQVPASGPVGTSGSQLSGKWDNLKCDELSSPSWYAG